ncbi:MULTISPECIES: DUF4293 domain-containing protein [Tenacibaculum]|uniref:DUF4293 domain-containing protein n=1 Tax=Tenacibaculum TaxID=104267 RepID=UPI001F0A50FE|nr:MULTISPECIES: DUF4293 domain-containing protein [Tenacibaculum]MCH3882879.1 DUF4293 domain-containing protein [Tenacibaculum aquimarinum]MCH3884412.1 DUF4293 domain-containing protein [Tenacibaculum aquimarinum]MDO6600412.1 DUF4293 domain-containing protein [Tenacibaculum sp. 1_MG-2023]
MIQRIQTIYLILAAIVAGGLIFVFNIWTVSDNTLFAQDFMQVVDVKQKAIPVLFILSSLISLITVFQFKNRKLQFVLGRVVILINLLLLGLLIYLMLTLSGEASVSEKGIGMFLPIIVILLTVFANKAIKKDEDLVKSVDRLR